jgi:tRNA uridine 5-carboxymethylaminomethyl modification enzyme
VPADACAFELLKRPQVRYADLTELTGAPSAEGADESDERVAREVRAQVEVRAKYAGYIERAQAEIERVSRNEATPLPEDLDYAKLAGLSHEVRQRLAETRPATLGQAGRVPGVTPAAVQILLVHLKRHSARVA